MGSRQALEPCRVGGDKPFAHLDGGCLTGPRAEQGSDLGRLDEIEIDTVDGSNTVEGLDDTLDLYRRRRRSGIPRSRGISVSPRRGCLRLPVRLS